jgi:predicted transcriptional regulator
MKTVQMTLSEPLIAHVDFMAKELNTTRSAFARMALQHELKRLERQKREARHAAGYQNAPVQAEEFDVWADEQAWQE